MAATIKTWTPTKAQLTRDVGVRRRLEEADTRQDWWNIAPYFGREGVLEQPNLDWALEGILQDYSVNMLFGESETYKTFFALDWAFTLSDPTIDHWHGHGKDRNFKPMYVFSEGRAGLKKRMYAWERQAKRETMEGEKGIVWIFDHLDLMQFEKRDRWGRTIDRTDEADAARLEQVYEKAGCNMLILDTLSATMQGDTNSNHEAQRYMDTMTKFAERGPVLMTHHTLKGDKKVYRGASTFKNSSDVMLRTTHTGVGDRVELAHDKFKDGTKSIIGIFDKKIHEEVDSMTLDMVDAHESELPKQQARILEILQDLKGGTVTEIAEEATKSKTATSNLLVALAANGLAEKDAQSRWTPILKKI